MTRHFVVAAVLLLAAPSHAFVPLASRQTVTSATSSHTTVARPSIASFDRRFEQSTTTTTKTTLWGASSNDDATADASSSLSTPLLENLKVAIVGGGPSGLLLAHHLLAQADARSVQVTVVESRPRPTTAGASTNLSPGRAYALGVGIRGRTAIQAVDDDAAAARANSKSSKLWQAVKAVGFASERFIVHAGPLKVKLRDGNNNKRSRKTVEPSILLYQSDLCRVLADQLEERYASTASATSSSSSPSLRLLYNTKVSNVDVLKKRLTLQDNTNADGTTAVIQDDDNTESFDLIVGCDGVNSVVRQSLAAHWPGFVTQRTKLPGESKVVRLPRMPSKMDPTAVALVVPKAGTVTAFVEPVANGGCCILFAGQNTTDPLLASSDATELEELVTNRFPLLVEQNDDDESTSTTSMASEMARQLAAVADTDRLVASSVTCNLYHYDSAVALVGDAAHATGGVSGQGVNSALQDANVLVECLVEAAQNHSTKNNDDLLRSGLLAYSQRQVPEGQALYDLSFGPKPTSARQRIGQGLATLRDAIFRGRFGIGRLPLQTLLTTSLMPFAEIRRGRDRAYIAAAAANNNNNNNAAAAAAAFPTQDEWETRLQELAAQATAHATAAKVAAEQTTSPTATTTTTTTTV